MAASPNLAWYRSFYWRIGITFVAFVVVILTTQGLILSYVISSEDAQDQYRAPVLAAQVAADVGAVLRANPHDDLDAHLRSHYPPERAGRLVFVAMRGGPLFSSTTDEVPETSGSRRSRRSASAPSSSATPCGPSQRHLCSLTIDSSLLCWCWFWNRDRLAFVTNLAAS